MTLEEKGKQIIRDIKEESGTNPVRIFKHMAKKDYISIHGPRCCKRDAMIAFQHAIEYVNSRYDVQLEYEQQKCEFSDGNQQYIKDRCPFYIYNNKNL